MLDVGLNYPKYVKRELPTQLITFPLTYNNNKPEEIRRTSILKMKCLQMYDTPTINTIIKYKSYTIIISIIVYQKVGKKYEIINILNRIIKKFFFKIDQKHESFDKNNIS